MNEQERKRRDELTLAMQQAALLGPDDPQRRELEGRIAAEGDWAEHQWVDLLEADERLRLALHRVEVPEGLADRLMTIPDEVPPRGRLVRWARPLAVAASVVVAVSAGLWLGASFRGDGGHAIVAVAILATDDHMNDRRMSTETANPSELAARLTDDVPFDVVMPTMGTGFELVGGRKCRWGRYPVVYSLWTRGRQRYSLVQFVASDLGLPPSATMQTVCCEQPGTDVVIWSKDGRGYALASDHGTLDGALAAVDTLKKGRRVGG